MDFRLKLEIELKDTKNGIVIADKYGNPQKGLDMSAHIVKSDDNKPNTSTLKIYNMSTDLYNLIYQQANAFRLSCARGIDGDYVPFYTGFPVRALKVAKETVLTSNQGFMSQDPDAGRGGQNDLETNITLMNYGVAKIYKSYQTKVNANLVLEDCIKALGLPKGNIDKNIQERLDNTYYQAGHTIRGLVSDELTRMGNQVGFRWNTNDMTLNIYDMYRNDFKTYGIKLTPYNSSTPEGQDDKFKVRSQMIQKANKKKGIKGVKAHIIDKISQGFKIQTQLLPHLQCGSTCFLEDFKIVGAEGNKYIYRIEHYVNNTGLNAYTEIFCV
jgi:hypothetical protein